MAEKFGRYLTEHGTSDTEFFSEYEALNRHAAHSLGIRLMKHESGESDEVARLVDTFNQRARAYNALVGMHREAMQMAINKANAKYEFSGVSPSAPIGLILLLLQFEAWKRRSGQISQDPKHFLTPAFYKLERRLRSLENEIEDLAGSIGRASQRSQCKAMTRWYSYLRRHRIGVFDHAGTRR